jgi:hypothetical protein
MNHPTYTHDPIELEDFDSFKDLVIKDIKNESSSEEQTILHNNYDAWLYNLRVIRRDVEFQLSSNRSKNKIKVLEMRDMGASTNDVDMFIAKQNKWRINTIKFLTAIEKKMLYVKILEKDV